jgi:hypothetical protein
MPHVIVADDIHAVLLLGSRAVSLNITARPSKSR